jgi:hypothetical protein
MMKRKAIAWVLILLLVLGALSGCKQENSLESAAPGDVVEQPETEPTEQDVPVSVEPEENKEEKEEKAEVPADQEQGEKQEETTSTQTPAAEEPAEKETIGEESAAKEFDKEAWLEEYLVEASVNYAISFNGKARFNMSVPNGTSKEEVEKMALAHESSAKWMEGKTPKKVIVVPNKIVNIVI